MTIYHNNNTYPAWAIIELFKHMKMMDNLVGDFEEEKNIEKKSKEETSKFSEMVPYLEEVNKNLKSTVDIVIEEAFLTGFLNWCEQDPEKRNGFPYKDWRDIMKPSLGLLNDMIVLVPKTQRQTWCQEALLWASNFSWEMDGWTPVKEWDLGTTIALASLGKQERNKLLEEGKGIIKAEIFLALPELIHAESAAHNVHNLVFKMTIDEKSLPPEHILHPQLWTRATGLNTYQKQRYAFNDKKNFDKTLASLNAFQTLFGKLAPPLSDFYYGLYNGLTTDFKKQIRVQKNELVFFAEAQETLLKLATARDLKPSLGKNKI